MRKAKTRIIYDNYDIWTDYHEEAEAFLKEEYDEEPTENDIWDEISRMDNSNWQDEKERLNQFFRDKSNTWVCDGTVGLWYGTYRGGFLFHTFDELISKAGQDCDYFSFTDENGHFYLRCSHSDGTHYVEVKAVTPQGELYYDNWNYGSDKRKESEVIGKIMERYSRLPHYMHQMYGVPKVEYEKGVA